MSPAETVTEGRAADQRISIDDIRAKFSELNRDVDRGLEGARQGQRLAIIIGVTVVVAAAYWLGRRRGRRRQTIVEIRRV